MARIIDQPAIRAEKGKRIFVGGGINCTDAEWDRIFKRGNDNEDVTNVYESTKSEDEQ
jgi:hypothetical protein